MADVGGSVTLSELRSLDDMRGDPDEYFKVINEMKKQDRQRRRLAERTTTEAVSVFDEMRNKEEEKQRIAIENEFENRWGWAGLPNLVLSHIMDHLPFRERFIASRVCKNWYWSFHSPGIWRELVLEEASFVRESSIVIRSDRGIGNCVKRTVRTGPHKGWLNSIGEYIKSFCLCPMDDYSVMSGHCAVVKRLIRICQDELGYYPLPRLKRFSFTFNPSLLEGHTMGTFYSGTGGNIMANITELVTSFKGLEDVCINDLLLETMDECLNLILGLINCCGTSIRRLQLLNLTRDPMSVSVFLFSRLHTLIVSPPQITSEMVSNFGQSDSLRKVHIVQDKYSTPGPVVEGTLWEEVKEKNPDLRVRLQVNDDQKDDIIIQVHAPVSEIIYKTKYSRISSRTVCNIIDNYSRTLKVYAHTCLPRFYTSKRFHERCDSNLVLLARNCLHLNTLVIRETVSTATLVLLVSRSRHIKTLIVRRNCVMKRCDWPKNVAWTDVWYDWYKQSSRCYERTTNDIREMLRQPGWKMLSDFEFSIFDVASVTDNECGLSHPNAFVINQSKKLNLDSSLDYCIDTES